MCEPITWTTGLALASAAAATGGSLLNSSAMASNQANAINEKNRTTAENLLQQKDLQRQSSAIFDETLQPFQQKEAPNLAPQQSTNTAALTANAPSEKALASGAIGGNAPKVVQDTANSSIASRLEKLRRSDAALGSLTGYDTANAMNARNFKAAGDRIGTIGTFANENSMVGQAMQNQAIANSQKAATPFGDLLQGAGQIGSYYAGKGFGGGSAGGVKKPATLESMGIFG